MKKAIKFNDRDETRWVIDDISSYYIDENTSNIITNLNYKYKIMITTSSVEDRNHLFYEKEKTRDEDIERLDKHFNFLEWEEDSILP